VAAVSEIPAEIKILKHRTEENALSVIAWRGFGMANYVLGGFDPIARGKFVKYFRRIHRVCSSEHSAE
jgi:hypothetical protein